MQLVALPIQAAVLSQVVIAEEAPTEPVYEPCPDTNGTSTPTGSSAHTYTFNPATCLWENAYYTWDPVTKMRTPLYDYSWTLNPDNGMLERTTWVYSPSRGEFMAVVDSKAPVVTVEDTGPGSNNEVSDGGGSGDGDASISNTGPESNNVINDPEGDTSISNTGPNSNNEANLGTINQTGPYSNNIIDYDNNGQIILNSDVDLNVVVDIDAVAQSGDAWVGYNTTGGDANTGDAESMANIINMIQSSMGINGVTPNLYTANLQGGHVGDIVIDPGALLGTSPCACDGVDELVVNSSVDAAIVNDIDLLAETGNATVIGNTTGGDATTGNANAVANIVNMINSSISAGESFIGVLNVDGDLEGDVLLADDILDQLIAANVPQLTLCVTCGGDGDTEININNEQTIVNDIDATATTGDATVEGNTTGGSATSGNAETNVNVFNLTGSHVVAENAILVFVNVLGEWVGFITNAPEGATAAALGNGVTSGLPTGLAEDTEINIDNDLVIVNDIDVEAHSGDATVAYNTTGGDATSGNANASVNAANITNSSFNTSGWFGLLFINIFGDWHGSFGTNTAYGDPVLPPFGVGGGSGVIPTSTSSSGGSGSGGSSGGGGVLGESVRVFSITNVSKSGQISFTEVEPEENDDEETAAAAATDGTASALDVDVAEPIAEASSSISPAAVVAASGLGFALVFGRQIIVFFRRMVS